MKNQKLSKVVFVASIDEAIEIINAFKKPFPSLDSVEAVDIIFSVVQKYGDKREEKRASSCKKIQEALYDSSFDGEWEGELYHENDGGWSPKTTIIPFCGDRCLVIRGGKLGKEHGELWHGLTVSCLYNRPSLLAAQEVIKLIPKMRAIEVLWADDIVEANLGKPISFDEQIRGYENLI